MDGESVSGSVTFVEVVGLAWIEVPVVRVDTAYELRRQISLRWTYLSSILLRLIAVAAVYRGCRGSAWKATAVAGSILAVGTGMALTM